jgi:predicted metalloprotease with PDZ domain
MIEYGVRLADLNRHWLEIECRIDAPGETERVSLPSWIPGSYLLREYARHVVSFEATSNDVDVIVQKIDHATWAVSGARATLVIVIRVHALDLSVRGAYLDSERGYFNGTCVFLAVENRDNEAIGLVLEQPSDPRCARWRAATAMQAVDVDERGFGSYSAQSYDDLIDHPIEISEHARTAFTAGGVPHALVIAGRHETDMERLRTDLSQLCETHIAFFGAPPPFDRYVFLGLAVDSGYGGLEHCASSSLVFAASDLPKSGEPGVPRDYQRFLGLCSHEYFHAWNVKRLRPAEFTPYRLSERNLTRQLWIFEGITSYYQDLMLLRAGLIGCETYLNRLAQTLTRVYRTPGRAHQSLAESSFDAWDKLYKPESNSPNATISYYTKGALVALALDLTVRQATNSAVSLDDIMRELWRTHGSSRRGLSEGEFERIAADVAGTDLRAFFDLAVRGTEDLALDGLLDAFGVELTMRPATGPNDSGGAVETATSDTLLWLGAAYRDGDGGVELTAIRDGGPAEAAGLCAGDVLIAIDGRRVQLNNVEKRLARFEPGETVPLAFFRRNELKLTTLQCALAPLDTCALSLVTEPDARALERREQWLDA